MDLALQQIDGEPMGCLRFDLPYTPEHRSDRRKGVVDEEFRSVDKAGCVRGKEQRDFRDFLGFADTPLRRIHIVLRGKDAVAAQLFYLVFAMVAHR